MSRTQRIPGASAPLPADARRPYEPPAIECVKLALEETLSAGCKLEGVCDAPPVPGFDGGS